MRTLQIHIQHTSGQFACDKYMHIIHNTDMEEKIAFVTGASSGIGMETTLELARNKYHTFAGIRGSDAPALEELVSKEKLTVTILPHTNVDCKESIEASISKITSRNGRLDVLVNNAGYGQFGCTEDVSISEFKKQFETNFFSIVQIIQKVVPVMRKQGSGNIINISSVAGRMGLPCSPAYISSKFALEGLTECLRYELGQFGIKVTLIEPGVVKTNFFESMRVPESYADPKYKALTEHILSGISMMVQMGTPPLQVADMIMSAIKDGDDMLPRYVVGADAEMFLKAKASKTDIEFERYMGEELFPK